MRRKEREVTGKEELVKIIEKCKVCRIGVTDSEGMYIVPVNFAYRFKKDLPELYFHSAEKGRKAEAFAQSPTVCFEMDCSHALITADEACAYGYAYESVMGTGKISRIDSAEEKKAVLSLLMKQQTGKEFEFSDRMVEGVAVFKITAETITGKCKKNS